MKRPHASAFPSTPTKPGHHPAPASPLHLALHRLHVSSVPSVLPCRTRERQALTRVFSQAEAGQAVALYVSGPPGTGKTSLINEVMGASKARSFRLNCMQIGAPQAIFQALVRLLAPSSRVTVAGAYEELVELSGRARGRGCVVAVVDEIDQLITQKDADVLYRLFEIPQRPGARLTVIGIANRIDLSEKFLPYLRARECEPETLSIGAYTKDEIKAVLEDRLEGLALPGGAPIFEPNALELCARKIGSTSGDMRKALGLCRTALEVAMAGPARALSADMSPGPASSAPPPRLLIPSSSPSVAAEGGAGRPESPVSVAPSVAFRGIWGRMASPLSPLHAPPSSSSPPPPAAATAAVAALQLPSHLASPVAVRGTPPQIPQTAHTPSRQPQRKPAETDDGPRVTLSVMAQVLSEALDIPFVTIIRGLPMQQQLALCATLLCIKGGERRALPLPELYERYARLVKDHCGGGAVPEEQFWPVVEALAVSGLLSTTKVAASKGKKATASSAATPPMPSAAASSPKTSVLSDKCVALAAKDDDIFAALSQIDFFSDILSDNNNNKD
jgi:Cdc6-like AAA superfamily ATPase